MRAHDSANSVNLNINPDGRQTRPDTGARYWGPILGGEKAMQAIFNCEGGGPDVLYEQSKNLISREFYTGDIATTGEGPITLFLEKGLSLPISVVHLSTPNRISYRRTHRHIQENQVDSYVVWAMRRGGIKLTRSSGSVLAGEGQLLIHDSSGHAEWPQDEMTVAIGDLGHVGP